MREEICNVMEGGREAFAFAAQQRDSLGGPCERGRLQRSDGGERRLPRDGIGRNDFTK